MDVRIDTPFPHTVDDGFYSPQLVQTAAREADFLRRTDAAPWQRFDNPHEWKWAMTFGAAGENYNLAAIRKFHEVFASETMCLRLGLLYGIGDLRFDELGGGVHAIPPGGHLDPHVDFNRDHYGRYRRVNLLLYLNEGWPTDDAEGALILYDDQYEPVRVIAPEANREVTFACGETSWHGHPIPHPARWRYSLAAYYFTTDPPPDPAPVHDTIWMPDAR